MGKTVVLEGRPLEWARERFRRYYARASIDPPARLARREYAAFPFTTETMMRRHAAFRSAEEFRSFLKREAPRHVYYSSAYYRVPDHPVMAQKGWLGADLIFDLDADHLRDAAGLSYADQLLLVKSKVRDLLDDFLFGDLGIDPARTLLVFSGGRGYHVHVLDEAYAGLSSAERREIVDYILGTGVEPRWAVLDRREGTDGGAVALVEGGGESDGPGRSRRGRDAFALRRLPEPDAPGWPGRITRSVHRLLVRWESEGEGLADRDLAAWKVPNHKRLAQLLVSKGLGRRIREEGSLTVLGEGALQREFLDIVLRQATIEVQGETDAPVTTDIHRLIRLPGSLHGGTGFRVVPLDRESLESFDPFREALPDVGAGPTRVTITEPVDHPFPGGLRAAPGDERELPDPVALFLVLRGEATLPA